MAKPRKGNYVLATKWSDGDPQDPWAIGFYDGITGITESGKGRHLVIDHNGKQFRHGGFRRIKEIKPEVGAWLLAHKTQIEMSTFSMYGWERHARKDLKETMTEHPLTDDLCCQLWQDNKDNWLKLAEPCPATRRVMRAVADWQMRQAIDRFNDYHLKTFGWSTAIIELERLLRPTTTQEDNND